ncbi:MAG: hypothetical protein U0871_12605 [Gemmataceae bacterium]
MPVTLSLALVAVLADLPASALQPPYEPTLVRRIVITPAAVPTSAVTDPLLPPATDRTPGNAALDYLRAFLTVPKQPRLVGDEWDARNKREEFWRTCPVDRTPVAELKQELNPLRASLRWADRAARRDGCDWQPARPLGPAMVGDLLPELQHIREVMGWLRLRAKVELAEGRFADARRTVQTLFQLGKHVGEGPTLIQSLVGVAGVAITLGVVDEWNSAPGSPNLYWSLATLPAPLLDPRPMLAGEMEFQAGSLPGYAELAAGPVSDARAGELTRELRQGLDLEDAILGPFRKGKPKPLATQAAEWAGGFATVWQADPARKWLKARGFPADKMSATQAVFLAAWVRARELNELMVTPFLLPPAEGLAARQAAERTVAKVQAEHAADRTFQALSASATAMAKVFDAHLRLRRQIAMQQAVQAVRAHLAATGTMPATWADVKVVPVPADPMTGKPFGYEQKDGVAKVIAPPPAGETPTPSNNLRYELRVKSP